MNNNEQQRGKEAFELHQKIVTNEEQRRKLWIENIFYLEKMREEELYRDYLGDENGKWAGYLSELEIFYTRSKVQRWIYILKKLVKPFDLPLSELLSVPESRLDQIAMYATKENYQELLQYASSLTSLDWRIELGKLKGQDLENCTHRMEKFEACKVCGLKHKINE